MAKVCLLRSRCRRRAASQLSAHPALPFLLNACARADHDHDRGVGRNCNRRHRVRKVRQAMKPMKAVLLMRRDFAAFVFCGSAKRETTRTRFRTRREFSGAAGHAQLPLKKATIRRATDTINNRYARFRKISTDAASARRSADIFDSFNYTKARRTDSGHLSTRGDSYHSPSLITLCGGPLRFTVSDASGSKSPLPTSYQQHYPISPPSASR